MECSQLAKTISDMIATQDQVLKELKEKEDETVDPYVSKSEIFYNKGIKRGLLNIAEKYDLDLEF